MIDEVEPVQVGDRPGALGRRLPTRRAATIACDKRGEEVDEIGIEALGSPEGQALGRGQRALAAELLDQPGRDQTGAVLGVEPDVARAWLDRQERVLGVEPVVLRPGLGRSRSRPRSPEGGSSRRLPRRTAGHRASARWRITSLRLRLMTSLISSVGNRGETPSRA